MQTIYPDSFLIRHVKERKLRSEINGFATNKLLLSFTAKVNYERGKQARLRAVLQSKIKDVCLLSYVHMYVNNTGKKKY